MQEHYSAEASKASFLEQVEEGTKNERWLGVLWTYDAPHQLTLRKTTSSFPTVEYISVLLTLKELLDQEITQQLAPQQPLPLAPHLQPPRSGVDYGQKSAGSFGSGVFPSVTPTVTEGNGEEIVDFPIVNPINEEKKSDEEVV